MPIYIPPISRRHFLAGTLATGAGLLLPKRLLAGEGKIDVNRWTLMADTHIWENRVRLMEGVKPADNFDEARRRILAAKTRTAGVIVAGDCAFLYGEKADYAVLADIIRPYREAGVPFHMALGNHDNRENFFEAFPETRLASKAHNLGKHVSIVKSPRVNFFLLDSLIKTYHTPGRLGKHQLQWLAKALDANADKPAIVVSHHDPHHRETTGLLDTEALYKLILPRKQVKAYVFGHTHQWSIDKIEGLHLVNLPTLAWIFDKKQPKGWADAKFRRDGMLLTLNALNMKHPAHGQVNDLIWRT